MQALTEEFFLAPRSELQIVSSKVGDLLLQSVLLMDLQSQWLLSTSLQVLG